MHDQEAAAMYAKRAASLTLQHQHLTLIHLAYHIHMHMLARAAAGKNQRLGLKRDDWQVECPFIYSCVCI